MTLISTWGPEIVSAILGGLVAGAFAWYLLSRTERGEARDRKRQTIGELLVELRNLRDTSCSYSIETLVRTPIYPLANRTSVAELEMGERPILQHLSQFAQDVRVLKTWVRAAPASVVSELNFGEDSAVRLAVNAYQDAIRQAATRLEQELKVEVNRGTVTQTAPQFPTLPDHPAH